MTFEKIRAALPTHIMLTPKRHFYAAGDEIFLSEKREWIPADDLYIGEHVLPTRISRRPIPPHILDNQAFYLWAGQYAGVIPTWENNADVSEHIREGRLYDKWLLEQMEDV